MTARTAQRITGMYVLPMPQLRKNAYGLFLQPHEACLFHAENGGTPRESIERLVAWNYNRVKNHVFTEQNYRCWSCYRIAPLSCDHIKPRAHGRSDDRLNLRGLCAPCHGLHTRNYQVTMHPKMETLMSKVGLRWAGEWSLGCQSYGWERISA